MTTWYVRLPDGTDLGDFELQALRSNWERGLLPRDVLVTTDRGERWIAASVLFGGVLTAPGTSPGSTTYAQRFWLAVGDDVRGPVTADLLVRGLEAGKVPPGALVLNGDGTGE